MIGVAFILQVGCEEDSARVQAHCRTYLFAFTMVFSGLMLIGGRNVTGIRAGHGELRR